jgi:uncharacterized protein YjbI with pentapeptide repeats
MANEDHIALLKKGVAAWNRWRKKNPDIRPNLSRASLNKANLGKADLSRANLTKADLSGANLKKADPSEANLTEANLEGITISTGLTCGKHSYLKQSFLTPTYE